MIPTFSPYEIYQYSNSMLKHLHAETLKTIEKTVLYSKTPVYYIDVNMDRRNHNHNGDGIAATGLTAAQITTLKKFFAKDLNIDNRITKFQNILKKEHVYRIPLRYFTDLGKINFPTKVDYRIKLYLETETKKLFESRKVQASRTAISTPDAKIIFTKAPFIQYEQILLDKNFRQYLETIMVSKKILRMGTQKTPIQKTYKINVGQDSLDIDFLETNRQFDWIELCLVYDKSDKHTTIYNIYNVEMDSKIIKSVKLTNFTEIYSSTNEKKSDINNLTQKHLLYKQFVAWSCIDSSVAPLTDYTNNKIYQELIEEDDYFNVRSDERLYFDLRASSGYVKEAEKLERNNSKINLHITLKNAATKKLRLRVWAHSLGEYLYILTKDWLTLRHRTYAINQSDEDLLE